MKKLRDFINGPIGGLAPWIAMSLLAGPGRFELAVGVAFAISLIVVAVGRAGGGSWKILELSDITFFTLVGILGLLVSQSTLDALDNWSGEMSNVALTVIAFGSILFRVPFTLQYAREEAPRELWDNPAFIRTNYVISAFWGGAFLVAALAGAYGDLILDNSNNLWTGWVIQTLALLVAIQFTEWYPKVVQARGPRRDRAGAAAERAAARRDGAADPGRDHRPGPRRLRNPDRRRPDRDRRGGLARPRPAPQRRDAPGSQDRLRRRPRMGQEATIPSPPAVPGTRTDPSGVSEPSPLTWNSSMPPSAPVWT